MVVMILDVNMLSRDPENRNWDMMGRRQTSGTRATGERHLDHNLPISTHPFFSVFIMEKETEA